MTASQPKKVCLVIGVGDGVGAAIAKAFALDGFETVITRRARNLPDLEGIAQNIDGFIRRQNRLATIRHKSEKEGAAGNDGASIVLGECRVALS